MEAFYDAKAREQRTRDERSASALYPLLQWNNWVKATLIGQFTAGLGLRVLDLCGGRGGDLAKWAAARIRSLVLVDISQDSVLEAQRRFDNKANKTFAASFHHGDAAALDGIAAANGPFDVVSCQFALHYLFDSEERARATLKGVAARLVRGGQFLVTIPSAARISAALAEGPVGNVYYSIAAAANGWNFHLGPEVNAFESPVWRHELIAWALDVGLAPVLEAVPFPKWREERRGLLRHMQPAAAAMDPKLEEVFALYDVYVFRKV
jgi:SAM-dependent methyltransferase